MGAAEPVGFALSVAFGTGRMLVTPSTTVLSSEPTGKSGLLPLGDGVTTPVGAIRIPDGVDDAPVGSLRRGAPVPEDPRGSVTFNRPPEGAPDEAAPAPVLVALPLPRVGRTISGGTEEPVPTAFELPVLVGLPLPRVGRTIRGGTEEPVSSAFELGVLAALLPPRVGKTIRGGTEESSPPALELVVAFLTGVPVGKEPDESEAEADSGEAADEGESRPEVGKRSSPEESSGSGVESEGAAEEGEARSEVGNRPSPEENRPPRPESESEVEVTDGVAGPDRVEGTVWVPDRVKTDGTSVVVE